MTQSSTHKITRRRCPEGERLHQAWDDAMETHEPTEIEPAMRAYFNHVNGVGRDEPCYRCWSWVEVPIPRV